MKARAATLLLLVCTACSRGGVVLDRIDAEAPGANRYDYCSEVPPLARAPLLDDGRVDEALPLAEVPSALWESLGSQLVPAGYSASIAAGWRPDGLYVFVDVTDPDRVPAAPGDPVWWGDAVELYVDHDGVLRSPPRYDDPGTRHLLFGAPADDVTAVTRVERVRAVGEPSTPWTGTQVVARPRAGGYTVEALVRAPDLDLLEWTLSAGDRAGFDVSFDVSYPNRTAGPYGSRLGSFVLRADPSSAIPQSFPFQTSRAFCLPTLRPSR